MVELGFSRAPPAASRQPRARASPGLAFTCVIPSNYVTKPVNALVGTDGTVKLTYVAGITSVELGGITPFIAEN